MVVEILRKTRIYSYILVLISCMVFEVSINAQEPSTCIKGNLYEFEKGSTYKSEEIISEQKIDSGSLYGDLSISGRVKDTGEVKGVPTYEVLADNVSFTYCLQENYLVERNNRWYIDEDNTKKIDEQKLGQNIGTGAILVQTSLTGENWVTDTIYTDIQGDEEKFLSEIYKSKEIQQVNGCYYRISVLYGLMKEEEVDKSITNWTGKETSYKKCAEVYTFYLINSSENNTQGISPTVTPRKELGSKVKMHKDSGYKIEEIIDSEDPHYGWDIGSFFVNGYTRETEDSEGNPVFLKNVGDKVTLWFNLQQDINKLNGKETLVIAEDIDGYNQAFQIAKTNFKRGALIIGYKDKGSERYEPIIYTNYLEANVSPNANTKVELFEEGDYEVVLNYQIEDRKGINSYHDYSISFRFSIRNGNCMVYPFDTIKGSELQDQSIVESAFYLDMAKSKYLTIDVIKSTIQLKNNAYRVDQRFNRPAKDGEVYEGEGIYTFVVKNLYTDAEPTEKVIYIGNNPVFYALAAGHTLEAINECIATGGTIADDGTLILAIEQENIIKEPEPFEEKVQESYVQVSTNVGVSETIDDTESEEILADQDASVLQKDIPWVMLTVMSTVGIFIISMCIFIFKRYRLRKTNQNEELTQEQQIAEEKE